jgi:hypothetical protein
MEILPTRYGPYSHSLHEIQLAIQLQKPLAAAAITAIHEARAQGEPADSIEYLAGQMQIEQECLHDMRQERNRLRNQMGINRKGEPLPYEVLPPGICEPDIRQDYIDMYNRHRNPV